MRSPLLASVGLAVPLLVASAICAEQGDLWQTTSKMSMEGMPMEMPAQTMEVCAEKEWKEPPAGQDAGNGCQRTEFEVAGPKVTWKENCAGPPAMTGVGEITRQGSDAYRGTIRYTSPDGAMTIHVSGRRVGTCDNP